MQDWEDGLSESDADGSFLHENWNRDLRLFSDGEDGGSQLLQVSSCPSVFCLIFCAHFSRQDHRSRARSLVCVLRLYFLLMLSLAKTISCNGFSAFHIASRNRTSGHLW